MRHLLFSSLLIFCTLLSLAQPTAGLVAYWPLNGNYTDAGPNAIHGTNFGSTATTNYASAPNTAMQFLNPGSTVPQYATASSSLLNFGNAQDFTIVFSVYANSPYIHPGGLFDNCLNHGGYGVWFWNANGYPQVQFNFKNASIGTTNGAIQLGVWKHVTAVRAGNNMRIYINGVLNVSGTIGTATPSYPGAARFGSMYYAGYTIPQYNGLNGKLDDMRIYNRALSVSEILIFSGGALPVKLTSFSAINNNNNIRLLWQTQYEQNSSHYNVQRSIDGINFTNVARVNAAGNSNTPLAYSHTDPLPGTLQNIPVVFYRLQPVDIDGQFAYSSIVAIHLNKKDMQFLVFPNPVKEILQVQTSGGMVGDATLIISDAGGRQLYKKVMELQQGSNSIPINVSSFCSGIYYIRLVNGSESFTKPFIKD